MLSGDGGNDTRNSTQSRQHTARGASVGSSKELGSRRVQNGIEVLDEGQLRTAPLGRCRKSTYRLHDVGESVQTDVTSSTVDLRVHGHSKTLANTRKDEGPLSTE